MRKGAEYAQNWGAKRGTVVARDPRKKRVKVKFHDEDETASMWIDVLARSSGEVKTFMMPGEADEVWCMVDAKGEDGCIVGSKYNDRETPPSNQNEHITIKGPFGTIHCDGANMIIDGTADVTIKAAGNITLEAGGDITTGQGGQLTNNGKNVGHDHKHTEVTPGPSLTGVPA